MQSGIKLIAQIILGFLIVIGVFYGLFAIGDEMLNSSHSIYFKMIWGLLIVLIVVAYAVIAMVIIVISFIAAEKIVFGSSTLKKSKKKKKRKKKETMKKLILLFVLIFSFSCEEKKKSGEDSQNITLEIIKAPEVDSIEIVDAHRGADEHDTRRLTADQLKEIENFRPWVQDVIWYIIIHWDRVKMHNHTWGGKRFEIWVSSGYGGFKLYRPNEVSFHPREKKFIYKLYREWIDTKWRLYDWNNPNVK